MKHLLTIAAPLVLLGTASAQQIPLPQSMDLTITPGAMPLSVPASGARATTACDDFNRTTGLGSDWSVAGGTPDIFNDMFGSLGGNSMAQHTVASVNYDSAVISFDLPDNPQTLTYGAAAHGLGGGDNTFTKVQRNGFAPGLYDTLGFYHGFNGGGAGGYGGFFAITGVVGGLVSVYVDPASAGDTMVVDIDENRDGVVDYTYTSTGIIANVLGMGTSVGLGAYQTAAGSCDDFDLNGGCGGPAGPTISLAGACPGAMTMTGTGFSASGLVAFVWGPAGAGSVPGAAGPPCAGLPIGIAGPNLIGLLTATAAGDIAAAGVAPGGCGVISVMAYDLGSCTESNIWLL